MEEGVELVTEGAGSKLWPTVEGGGVSMAGGVAEFGRLRASQGVEGEAPGPSRRDRVNPSLRSRSSSPRKKIIKIHMYIRRDRKQ